MLEFTEEECEGESKGHWYFRQMLGSGNITGGRLFHIMSGNLSFQIEHHLFPDIPARRYQQIAPEVREICQRYGIPYNTGRLSRQFGSVIFKIFRFALPGRSSGATPAQGERPCPSSELAPHEPAELLAACHPRMRRRRSGLRQRDADDALPRREGQCALDHLAGRAPVGADPQGPFHVPEHDLVVGHVEGDDNDGRPGSRPTPRRERAACR